MADVKWIKIVTDIFDNRKIRQIEIMPEGDSILVIWFKLICLAGSINDNGMIYLTKDIPYTEEMLANQFNRPLNTVRMALKVFEQFGMIEIEDNFLYLSSWEKYQSVDKMERIKEQARIRKQRQRQKMIAESGENTQNVTQCHADVTGQVTQCHAVEEDKERDIERDKEKERENGVPHAERAAAVPYEEIRNLYNSICVSFPKCTVMSDARKKAVAARFKSGHELDDFRQLFQKAEASGFLKGRNGRNWRADFDWLIKDANFAKVIDGNYDDHRGVAQPPQRLGDLDFLG